MSFNHHHSHHHPQLRRSDAEIPRPLFILLTWLGLVMVLGIMVKVCRDSDENVAHARDEVPPPIANVRGFAERPRSVPVVVTGRQVAAVDGPMCEAPRFLEAPPLERPSLETLLLVEPPTEHEREVIDRALTACEDLRGPVRLSADPFVLLSALRYGHELGTPEGFFLGAMCVESALRARPSRGGRFLGDWKDGKARASGPLQLHENVWSGTCGGTSESPHDRLWAMGCYWTEVQRVTAKARRVSKCDEADLLRVGEAAAANVRVYGFRCDSMSHHWRVMLEASR